MRGHTPKHATDAAISGAMSGPSRAGTGSNAARDYASVPAPVQRKAATAVETHSYRLPVVPDLFGGILDQPIMRKAAPGTVAPTATAALTDAASSSGLLLPSALRGKLEQKLGGQDLSAVRVHTGTASATAADAIAAKAFTTGNHIHFAAGQYDPTSKAGQHLLSHEVAHTVQQQGVSNPTRSRTVNDAAELGGFGGPLDAPSVSQPGDAHEQQADAFADAFVAGNDHQVDVTPGSAPAGELARKAAGSRGPNAVMVVSAWNDLMRIKKWQGPVAWARAFGSFTAGVRNGRITSWRGGAISTRSVRINADKNGRGGTSLLRWLPKNATLVMISVTHGATPAADHKQGPTDREPLTVNTDKKQLTTKQVYGGRPIKNPYAGQRLGGNAEWAKYERITGRTSLKKRFDKILALYRYGGRNTERHGIPQSFHELFQFGLNKRGMKFHKWEKHAARRLFSKKTGQSAKRLKRLESTARYNARRSIEAGGKRASFSGFSSTLNEIFLRPAFTAAWFYSLGKTCTDPKHQTACLGAMVALRARIRKSPRMRTGPVPRKVTLRRLDKLIRRNKRSARIATRDVHDAVARLTAMSGKRAALVVPFDRAYAKALADLASASLRRGITSAKGFILQVNKIRVRKGTKRLTKKGESQAESIFQRAKSRRHWGTPRTRGKKTLVKTKKGHKKGKPNKQLSNPKPNHRYDVNGYTYVTDGEGRVVEVIATKLRKKTGRRYKGQQRTAGGKNRLANDQGGHGIGTQFDGPGEAINLFAQSKNINLQGKPWANLENVWKKALAEGKEVSVRIRVQYPKGSKRPKRFHVEYRIGRDSFSELIANK